MYCGKKKKQNSTKGVSKVFDVKHVIVSFSLGI